MSGKGRKTRLSAFVVAGTSSGAGKTLLTLGVMEALRRRGLAVAPFKAGPDYIDPGLHARLLGRPSYNLDTWMMGQAGCQRTFAAASAGADCAVVEGVMGLFDGRDGTSEAGSTAHLAKTLGLPVVLVADAAKAARSMGAVVKGFRAFDDGVDLRWVVFNRVGSPRHEKILRDSVRGSGVKVLGAIPREASLVLEERHLGLATARDIEGHKWLEFVKKAGDIVEERLDIDALLKASRTTVEAAPAGPLPEPSVRVAVALDRAFCFYYQENLDMLRSCGAELVFFSPLVDRGLPEGAHALYIGGGYPELHMKALEENRFLRDEIRRASGAGMPIFAECGGLMYLGKSIENGGRSARMAGVFPFTTRLLARRKALGYREVSFTGGCPFIVKGRARGHEFHYSEPSGAVPDGTAFKVKGADGTRPEGLVHGMTLASYIHLHFASSPAFAAGFIKSAREFKRSLP